MNDKFDFDAAIESLIASMDAVSVSYAEMVAAESACDEAAKIMHDCQLALESIQNHGMNAVNMSLCNGADHALDRALGLRDLSIESLEALDAEAKKLLEQKYVAGLEGAVGDAVKNFVAKVKEFIARVTQWIKDFLMSEARVTKIVQELVKAGIKDLDPDKMVVALSKKNADFLDKGIRDAVKNVVICSSDPSRYGSAEVVSEFMDGEVKMPKLNKEHGSVEQLGWDKNGLTESAKKYCEIAVKDEVSKIWKVIAQRALKDASEYCQREEGRDILHSEEVTASRNAARAAAHFIALYGKMLHALGMTIITVSKAQTDHAKTPEERADIKVSGPAYDK